MVASRPTTGRNTAPRLRLCTKATSLCRLAEPLSAIMIFSRTGFAKHDKQYVLRLPGNPTSALVAAHLFLQLLVGRMAGAETQNLSRHKYMRKARLIGSLTGNGAREEFIRGVVKHGDDAIIRTTPFSDQDSSLTSVFSKANALINRPAGHAADHDGDLISHLPL